MTVANDTDQKLYKEMTWTIVSNKMDKTCVIVVDKVKYHPLYKKRYIVSKRYYAHDAENKGQIGDKVVIKQMRPMSKLKRWNIISFI